MNVFPLCNMNVFQTGVSVYLIRGRSENKGGGADQVLMRVLRLSELKMQMFSM